MRKIWKYKLQVTEEQIVPMPKSAEILSVANQDEVITVWAMVDPSPEEPKKNVKFYIVGTDHPITFPFASVKRLGTVLTRAGSLVWHVFYTE